MTRSNSNNSTNDETKKIKGYADSIAKWIGTDADRFGRFIESWEEPDQLGPLLRQIEMDRILEGGEGEPIGQEGYSFLTRRGANTSKTRESLFMAVAEAMAGVELTSAAVAPASSSPMG